MQFRRSLQLCLVLTLALTACRAPQPGAGGGSSRGGPSSGGTDPDGFNLVVVTDVSQSMQGNDRDGFNRQGAQLAVALADVTDSLGLVAFNSGIQESLPLTAMNTVRRRKNFDKKIGALRNERSTDYLKALAEAEKLLARRGPSAKSAIIFLSDGDHDPGLFSKLKPEEAKRQIRARAGAFGDQERPLYTIAFTDTFVPELMKDMAVDSGGAYYAVKQPADLLDAYLEVLGDVYELFHYTKDPARLKVDKLTRRLVYVLIKDRPSSDASLEGLIERDDQVVDFRTALYHRPAKRGDAFDVVQFSGDMTGEWRCRANARDGRVVLLSQVPLSFRIVPGSPAPEYDENSLEGFEVEAQAPDDEMAGYAENLVKVRVHSEAAGRSSETLELTPRREGTKVIFSGSTYARRLAPRGDDPEQQDVFFEITLGGGAWTHTKQRTTRVVVPSEPLPEPPKEALAITSDGERTRSIDLGHYWTGEVDMNRTMQVQNTHSVPVTIAFKAAGLVVPPSPIELAPGATADVPLTPRGPKTAAGTHRGTLTLTPTASQGSTELTPQSVDLSLTVYGAALRAPKVGALQPGAQQSLEFGLRIQPQGVPMRLTVEETESPAGLSVGPWPEQVSGSSFEVPAALDEVSSGGNYAASLSLTPVGRDLTPRRFPLEFEVGTSRPTLTASPARLELRVPASAWKAEDTWYEFEQTLELSMSHYTALPWFSAKQPFVGEDGKDLRTSDLRVRVSPLQLQPGQPGTATLALYLNEYVSPGRYTGAVTLEVELSRDDVMRVDVPVTIEVQR